MLLLWGVCGGVMGPPENYRKEHLLDAGSAERGGVMQILP